MRTSEDVHKLGLYASSCCLQELIFAENDYFSRCPCCEGLCEWELVETLVSWDQMKEEVGEDVAA